MNRRLLAAPLLAALSATAAADLPLGPAELVPSTHVMTSGHLRASLEGAEGTMFFVLASRDEDSNGFRLLGRSAIDAHGRGEFQVALNDESVLPKNFRVYLRAAYFGRAGLRFTEPSSVLLNPTPRERLNFTWGLGGERIEAGEVFDQQWTRRGIDLEVRSFNSDVRPMAIAVDSADPSPAAELLRTPGRGDGNDRELLNLLVVAGADTDRDQDGRVDRPFAEPEGGLVTFHFARPTFLDRITLVNAVVPGSELRCFRGNQLLGRVGVPVAGENSVQELGFPFEAVTKLEVLLCNDAGIAELTWLPCPEEVDFDRTMTGIPVDLAPGEVVRHQLGDWHAVRFSAVSNNPCNPGLPVILPRPEVPYSSDTRTRLYEENVLVIAADPTDRNGDGYVDQPKPEPRGGEIVIDFDGPVRWNSARVADVDCGEVSFFVAEDARGDVVGIYPLVVLGDNVVQTVQADLGGVTRLRLVLGGTAALVDLSYCSEEQFPRLTYEAPGCPPHSDPPQQLDRPGGLQ